MVWDAPIEALGRQDGEFGFCQIEPGAMLGGVDPFEAADEAATLGRGERFVERRLGVDVQVVLEQVMILASAKWVSEMSRYLFVLNNDGLSIGTGLTFSQLRPW